MTQWCNRFGRSHPEKEEPLLRQGFRVRSQTVSDCFSGSYGPSCGLADTGDELQVRGRLVWAFWAEKNRVRGKAQVLHLNLHELTDPAGWLVNGAEHELV